MGNSVSVLREQVKEGYDLVFSNQEEGEENVGGPPPQEEGYISNQAVSGYIGSYDGKTGVKYGHGIFIYDNDGKN